VTLIAPTLSIAQRLCAVSRAQRVPSPALELLIVRNVVSAADCEALIALVDAGRRPSTIADANSEPLFRTSETCDLPLSEPVVAALDAQLAAMTGIDPACGEPPQGQRYAPGQEFKAHTDYFEPDGADFTRFCATSGQRTWTLMLYLNGVDAGGATRFVTADKIVRPETGKLLAWNNRRADGSVNPATLHQGMPVRRGVKYVITKWYRERAWG
jgi:prolyl 4-hydroxylase